MSIYKYLSDERKEELIQKGEELVAKDSKDDCKIQMPEDSGSAQSSSRCGHTWIRDLCSSLTRRAQKARYCGLDKIDENILTIVILLAVLHIVILDCLIIVNIYQGKCR